MATIDLGSVYTASDLAARLNDNKLQTIINELTEDNPLVEVGQFEKANNNDYHKITRQTALPTGSLVGFNEGVAPTAGSVKPVTEYMSMVELKTQVDIRLAKQTNAAEYRAQHDRAAREGLLQQMAGYFFYGDHTDSEKQFDGLATRLSDASLDTVYDNGGSGATNRSSIYIVQFGPQKTTLIYPPNHPKAGMDSEDLGQQLVEDASGNQFRAYVTWHQWYMGLAVHDTRTIRRIANIDVDASPANGFDPDILMQALVDLPMNGEGAYVLMNKAVYAQLLKNAKDKMNVQYNPDAPYGPKTRSDFIGYPIRIFEQITNSEAAVS